MNAAEHEAELHAVIGDMLDHVSGRIREKADAWLRDGKDVLDLVFVIGVRGDGAGSVGARSRRELAIDLLRSANEANHGREGLAATVLAGAAEQLITGPTDKLPAVFMVLDPPGVHVAWIEPISSTEVH